MREIVIISGARTPIGRFGGVFKDLSAAALGATAISAALERSGMNPASVDEVIMGNVNQAADSGYMARKAMLAAGLPETVPAMTVNRACSSGLEAINMAAHAIMVGEADVVVAGGAESMSQAPYLLPANARFNALKMGDATLVDTMLLSIGCPINDYPMGTTAENIAARYAISRHDQDALALQSHQRAVAAQHAGHFDAQITPVSVPQSRGEAIQVTQDEQPRADTSLKALAKLRPIFKEDGTVTAGNSAGVNDAAAAVVVMSAERAEAEGLTPRLRWVGRGIAGVDPAFMGTGPVPATRKVMQRTGLTVEDMGVIELNEAFAAQALYVIRELNLDMERTNPDGSGISLGHPLGATGAIMVVKLMEELTRTDAQFALATLCVGGGQGVATIFERLS
jgi:acetyl-CoA C-acetyltransferase